jgi:SAM-dependent methyltransferase
MKMTRLEKRFVNRRKKAEGNIKKIQERLQKLDTNNLKDALEIGCGIGLVSAYLADHYGMNVYGTDFDPEEIQIAKQLNHEGNKLRYQVEDAANLSFAENRFDLVVSQNVFHHMPNWEQANKEIYRVLRPNGYLIWFDLVLPKLIKKLFKPISKNYGLYTFEEIYAVFNSIGFKIILERRIPHGPFKYFEMVMNKV